MKSSLKTGVLLVNLGTPDSTSVPDVRRYLREFLSDPRVIDIPALARWLLLNGIILRTRPRRSAAAYAKIWLDEGSPLRVYSEQLAREVSQSLGPDVPVVLAMRYGKPSIEDGLHELLACDLDELVILPLFPQYATATQASITARVFEVLEDVPELPAIRIVGAFHDHPAFIDAVAEVAAPQLASLKPDHVVMSFHGLPERQVRALDESGAHCFERDDCCEAIGKANRFCYRAHCFSTAHAIAAALELDREHYSIAFQSRLGRAKWIDPDLVEHLPALAEQGVKRVAVLCPSFVTDCLETVEEIGIRARAQWQELGGDALELVACVNAHPAWVRGVCDLVRENATGLTAPASAAATENAPQP